MAGSRGLLEELRQQTLGRLARLRAEFDGVVVASQDSNADDEHDPEGATIAFERSQLASLVRQAQHDLAEIDAAVARMDGGVYGVCESCGRSISTDRLDARPVARTCIGCVSSR